jgi:two-component system response regulator TtrR
VKHLPKVFVVDDDAATLKSVEIGLAPYGYDIRYFKSSAEFMAQYHPSQVGCVLLDVLIPGTGGSELLWHLQDTGSMLSVVIISELTEPGAYIKNGNQSVSVLEKPYQTSTLLAMIADGVADSFRRRAERFRGGGIQ